MPSAVSLSPTMAAPLAGLDHGRLDASLAAHRQFKKHKILPHPRNESILGGTRSVTDGYDLIVDTTNTSANAGSQTSSPRTLKHQSRRIGTGPDLPPTPPNHSRASSGTHSAQPPSPKPPEGNSAAPLTISRRPPATPPDQRSPPTPDVTPPQPANRPRALRPSALERGQSRTTTAAADSRTESRTESFKTAREDPFSSEDEAGWSSVRAGQMSATTSQTTVLRVPMTSANGRTVPPLMLDLALERLNMSSDDSYTPGTRGELDQFDGEWFAPGDLHREWDDNLQRYVTISRRELSTKATQTPKANASTRVVEDNLVTPTNATRAVRNLPLHDAAAPKPTIVKSTHSQKREATAALRPEVTVKTEKRRPSSQSTQSTPTAVVEAILVDKPSPPQRKQTLRHVRKRRELREQGSSPQQPATKSNAEAQGPAPGASVSPSRKEFPRRPDSFASTSSAGAVGNGRARREVWKSGGIPVVVIPDRLSSHKSRSSREPSLRSTSSRRSRRSRSVPSSPLDLSSPHANDNNSDREARWDRAAAASERTEQRTIDFAPVIPARSSSLSAPTSRNASRSGSLTAESIRALNNMHRKEDQLSRQSVSAHAPPPAPTIAVQAPLSPTSEREPERESTGLDHHDDAASAKKYSSRNTPFSMVSFETNWTAPEVSEAMAVHMYPHQNSSVLMVNHSSKPSDASDSTAQDSSHGSPERSAEPPQITATNPDGGLATPQQRSSVDEVDSPLRNPRAPPDPPADPPVDPSHPPAINFIPATPSGLTPAEEKALQLGNFYDQAAEKPSRRPSLVRRAFSRRRHSISYPPSASKGPGLLARTFSLSRGTRKSSDQIMPGPRDPDMDSNYAKQEDRPAEEDKLHPNWRPQFQYDGDDDMCDCDECLRYGRSRESEVYRYPRVDNRPKLPGRSLSARMKQTFAILPTREGQSYPAEDNYGAERRTIQRTPSGNLRVTRQRASTESLRRQAGKQVQNGRVVRPTSEGSSQKPFWRGYSLRRRPSHERLRRASVGSRFENLPSLTRMLSDRRREKRTQELRQKISGPTEVRDGLGEVTRPNSMRVVPNGYTHQK